MSKRKLAKVAAVPEAEAKPPVEPYRPTAADVAAAERVEAWRRERIAPPNLTATEPGKLNLAAHSHAEADAMQARLSVALGSVQPAFINMATAQLGGLRVADGKVDEWTLNGLLAAVAAFEPQDEVEAQMATLAVAMHHATMEALRRANVEGQSFEARNANLGHANKSARTFATLVETLNRHRGKGQQKVTVEHVHVHEGGQAIVGAVAPATGGRG